MSQHFCYILQSINRSDKVYIGYTVDMTHRIRQHNGEIVGGAKKTSRFKPWRIVCVISGFLDNHMALRFEFRLQKMAKRKNLINTLLELQKLISLGEGSKSKNTKCTWPALILYWYISQNLFPIIKMI